MKLSVAAISVLLLVLSFIPQISAFSQDPYMALFMTLEGSYKSPFPFGYSDDILACPSSNNFPVEGRATTLQTLFYCAGDDIIQCAAECNAAVNAGQGNAAKHAAENEAQNQCNNMMSLELSRNSCAEPCTKSHNVLVQCKIVESNCIGVVTAPPNSPLMECEAHCAARSTGVIVINCNQ